MIESYLRTTKRFSRDVRLYLFTSAILGFVAFGGVYPVLFNLYLLRLDYGSEFVGLINSVGMLTFAICSLPAGMASRVVVLGKPLGRRRTMVTGLSLATLGFALVSVVEFLPAWLWSGWLVASFGLRALGFALYWVNARPFLMDATSPQERYQVYSVAAAIVPLAGFAGSLIAGMLPGAFGSALGIALDRPEPYRYPLWIAAALLVPAVLAVIGMREFGPGQVQEHTDRAGRAPFGLIGLLSLTMLLQAAGQGTARSFFNVYLDDGLRVPTSTIGTITAVGQLVAAFAALATPSLVKKWGNSRVLFWGSLFTSLGLLPLALIQHWLAAGSGFLIVTVLGSITLPALNVFQMELVTPRWRTTMSGAMAMANGMSWSAMSLSGGYIIAALGYRSFFVAGAGLTFVGALLFWALFRVPRGELAKGHRLEG